MDQTERTKITIIVNDEDTLYSSFSPEPEFSDKVQLYIKSKAAVEDMEHSINLHVLSRVPLDEDRFRTAVSNWIRQERALFRKIEKETIRMLIGLLVFGSIFIILSLALEKRIGVLKYTLIPILGSLALSRATGILIVDMPTIKAQRWMLNGLEKNNMITFEYDSDKELV